MLRAKTLDIEELRADFPVLRRLVRGKPLVYLDNAATSQKPRAVIEALTRYYAESNANIHRAVHTLGEEATAAYEAARDKVMAFVNAAQREEVIFTRNTTEALNLVMRSWAEPQLRAGDTIVVSRMEHHSNFVPWQQLALQKDLRLRVVDITADGFLNLEELNGYVEAGPKVVALTHMSNVLGTVNPIREIARRAHRAGAVIVVDGAQSVPHLPVDFQDLDCDFLAFSAHKMLGPTGVGVLVARRALLETMPPFLYGGDMIKEVHVESTRFNDLPWKYEAGTSNIADVIAFGVAIDYLSRVGMGTVRRHERELTRYALEALRRVKGLTIYGPKEAEARGGVIAFNLGDIHPHDLATILDEDGIAIRSGHHCAQPLMERLNVPAMSRASFYVYNTEAEVDLLVQSLERARRLFRL